MLGVNGVGKTTLLHTLAGIRPAQAGNILLNGASKEQLGGKAWARRLGVVFQDVPDLFPTTVLETVLTGRYPHSDFLGWEREHDRAVAREALSAVGLSGMEEREATSLSGGERQRLRLAAFLAQETTVGLLDEPTNHLDPVHQVRLLSFLTKRTQASNGTLLMALHDVNWVARFCDHCLLLYGSGQIRAGRTAEQLTAENLQALYRYPMISVSTPWGCGWLPN